MLAGGRNSRCNPLDDSPLSFALCVSFSLVDPWPEKRAALFRKHAFRREGKARSAARQKQKRSGAARRWTDLLAIS